MLHWCICCGSKVGEKMSPIQTYGAFVLLNFEWNFISSPRYPEARSIERKFIFHAGPTNSGKTYHALERFVQAKSGIYCGPLKLLASEVFKKCNDKVNGCAYRAWVKVVQYIPNRRFKNFLRNLSLWLLKEIKVL